MDAALPNPRVTTRLAGANHALSYLIAEFLVPTGDLQALEVEFGIPLEVLDIRRFGRLRGQVYAVNEAFDAAIWHTCGPGLGEGKEAHVGYERPYLAGAWDLDTRSRRRARRSSKRSSD